METVEPWLTPLILPQRRYSAMPTPFVEETFVRALSHPLKSAPANPLEALFGRFPTLEQVEEYMVNEAMKISGGNQGVAASMLGISRQTLNKRVGAKVRV